jgi:leader peptidase (prepilin peptidase) / N-methyltransferase
MNYDELAAAILLGLTFGSYFGCQIRRYTVNASRSLKNLDLGLIGLADSDYHSTTFSSCENCKKNLKWHQNIPIFSFVSQRGKCAECGARIPRIHLIAETISLFTAILLIGNSSVIHGLILYFLMMLLLALAYVDYKLLILPERWLIWLICLSLSNAIYVDSVSILNTLLLGGLIGFASLEALRLCYSFIRKREGMGDGDPVLGLALGLLVGIEALFLTIATASLLGIGTVLVLKISGKLPDQNISTAQIPFGTLLIVALIIVKSAEHVML